jgi:hypothetical protein
MSWSLYEYDLYVGFLIIISTSSSAWSRCRLSLKARRARGLPQGYSLSRAYSGRTSTFCISLSMGVNGYILTLFHWTSPASLTKSLTASTLTASTLIIDNLFWVEMVAAQHLQLVLLKQVRHLFEQFLWRVASRLACRRTCIGFMRSYYSA